VPPCRIRARSSEFSIIRLSEANRGSILALFPYCTVETRGGGFDGRRRYIEVNGRNRFSARIRVSAHIRDNSVKFQPGRSH